MSYGYDYGVTLMENIGHGHVYPRPDGVKARCGGPALCPVCAAEYFRKIRDPRTYEYNEVIPPRTEHHMSNDQPYDRIEPGAGGSKVDGRPHLDERDDPMLQFFTFAHLPAQLQAISQRFYGLARDLVATLPRNPERSAALRKLLEAKDCAVRAAIYRQ